MRSAFAEAIAMFLASGGKVTRCPDGIGLGEPARGELKLIGQARIDHDQVMRLARRFDQFLESFPEVSWTLADLIETFGCPFDRAEAAMAHLVEKRHVLITRGHRRRTRLYTTARTTSRAQDVA